MSACHKSLTVFALVTLNVNLALADYSLLDTAHKDASYADSLLQASLPHFGLNTKLSAAKLIAAGNSDIVDLSWFTGNKKPVFNDQLSRQSRWHSTALARALPGITDHENNTNQLGDAKTELPLWYDSNGLTTHGQDLIRQIDIAAKEGISSKLISDKEFNNWILSNPELDPVAADKQLDQAFVQLARLTGTGIIDPLVAQKEWYRPADSIDADQLRKHIRSGIQTPAQAIDSVRPTHRQYAGLITMLERLQKMPAEQQVHIDAVENFGIGDEGSHVQRLRKALINYGDLAAESLIGEVFDSKLKKAVIQFQSRHGLTKSGIVDEKTLAALNTPITQRIDQVKANLERWRWFPTTLESTHILVNVPEYRLHMSLEGNDIFTMDVVVGKYRHMTPIFSETMKFMEFAPTWTVPASITNEELLPLEAKRPGYLLNEEIDFYRRTATGLQRVPRSEVTPEQMAMRPFPFVLRQRAGDKNVLGKVKFLMPNKHAIYLHDTKAKKLFGETHRAFSHGCIRLSNPDLMAHVLLQLDGYDQSAVHDFMALEETTRVNMNDPIPVHLAYFTAWLGDDGVMNFREDIYRQDQRLIKALQSADSKFSLADLHD